MSRPHLDPSLMHRPCSIMCRLRVNRLLLICTSEGERQAIIEAITAGFDGYRLKPFNRESLIESLHSLNARFELKKARSPQAA